MDVGRIDGSSNLATTTAADRHSRGYAEVMLD
jgi:hypothetical protein